MKVIADQLPVKTNRLIIRKINKDDCNDYYEIFGSSFISRYDDYEPIKTEDADENIAEILENYEQNSDEQEFAVEEPESGRMIGVLYIYNETNTISIGYHFNQQFHGKGYAIETLQSWIPMLKNCFEKPVKALVHPDNEPSKRLLTKLGFKFHCSRLLPETNTPEEEYILK